MVLGVIHILCNYFVPIAHFEAFYPYFWGNISKLASPRKQWVPGHPEVRWSRFVSLKKPCFRHNFWTETLISPIFTTSTPPLAIHGWKAMDLSFNLAPSYRDLKDPTTRQNFEDTVEQKRVIDLKACHMSQLVWLRGKHTCQTAHCAVVIRRKRI